MKPSIPEIIQDGKTGFLVNSSEIDIKGDWIVKKTGVDGLCEAIEKIHSMEKEEYERLRQNCRTHFEKYFTAERMVKEYLEIYRTVTSNQNLYQ